MFPLHLNSKFEAIVLFQTLPLCKKHESVWFKSLLYLLHGRFETGVSCCSTFFFFSYFSSRSGLGTQCRHDSSSVNTRETAALSDLKYDTLRRPSGVSKSCLACGTCIKQHKPLYQVYGFIFINILPQIKNEF